MDGANVHVLRSLADRDLREALCRIVRERKRGESAVAALRRAFRKLVKGDIGPERSAFFATVEASSALQAHARLFAELCERQLAQTLIEAAGAGEATTARVLAAMITSLARELTARVMSDASEDTIPRRYRGSASEASSC